MKLLPPHLNTSLPQGCRYDGAQPMGGVTVHHFTELTSGGSFALRECEIDNIALPLRVARLRREHARGTALPAAARPVL